MSDGPMTKCAFEARVTGERTAGVLLRHPHVIADVAIAALLLLFAEALVGLAWMARDVETLRLPLMLLSYMVGGVLIGFVVARVATMLRETGA